MTPDSSNPPDETFPAPSLLQALTPVAVMVGLLSLAVYLFGADSSYGPNQIALCTGAVIAGLIGWRNGLGWNELETAMVEGISIALRAMLTPHEAQA